MKFTPEEIKKGEELIATFQPHADTYHDGARQNAIKCAIIAQKKEIAIYDKMYLKYKSAPIDGLFNALSVEEYQNAKRVLQYLESL